MLGATRPWWVDVWVRMLVGKPLGTIGGVIVLGMLAAAVLADRKVGKARTATIRTKLINIPARLAFSAGTHTLHLPATSRRERAFLTMFDSVQAPPNAA